MGSIRASIEGRTHTQQASANLQAALAALQLAPKATSDYCPHPLVTVRAETESALAYIEQATTPTLAEFPRWMTATPDYWARAFLAPCTESLVSDAHYRQRLKDVPGFVLAVTIKSHAFRRCQRHFESDPVFSLVAH